MGYRLELSEINYITSGGKLFGYVEDETKLESYQWLLNRGYITGNKDEEYWDYGYNPQIILSSYEFKEFIELYNRDCNKYIKNEEYKDWILKDEKIQKLINEHNEVLLEWC